jgi:asparagine synthase (glutamine-hydrolysing)
MCGIAGLIPNGAGRLSPNELRSFLESLHHRGPDDYGWCTFARKALQLHREAPEGKESCAILGHRRLAILDLTEAGRQPMATADGRYVIVHNGEIYNFLELRKELEDLGHTFHSHSDTEVLLKGYAQWGAGVLEDVVGMFAFAILDTKARTLFLARDFFGIKPLYFTHWRDGFAFASEPRPLLNLPGVDRRVNPKRLFEYLRSGLSDYGKETLFDAVHQLPAAHSVTISLDNHSDVRPVCYWRLELSRPVELSFADAAERLREIFLDSVRLHLRSDVPVGAALSGGIDSSSIVMAIRSLNPQQTIHTFSYVADDPALNEERWVEIIGASSQAVVHKVRSQPEQLVSDLERLVDTQGEPFSSTSIYSQNRVFAEAASNGIKVMLDGQGADELLGGYELYAGARLASLVRQGKWNQALHFWQQASKVPRKNKLWHYLGQFLLSPAAQSGLRSLVGREYWPAWLNRAWFQERGVSVHTHFYNQENLRETLSRTLTETSLPMLLRYEDRNSMAHSIESRVPFLTRELAEFVLSLPEEFIIAPDGTSKAVFREAMRGLVPDTILDRKDKIGFETPEKQWLCGDLRHWVEQVLNSEDLVGIKALHASTVKQEWQAVLRGRKRFDNRIWRWVNLAVWARLNGAYFD